VVDDQKLVRAVTSDFLKSQGYHVLEASSGPQALEVAAGFQGTIDALVTDVAMPGMEGPTLALRLRESRTQLKVVFVSGYAAQGADMQRSLAEGARFLSKPVSLHSLATELRTLLK
jgi:two-component system, cell cycle sensor histidine kinase and response regulator CckA